MSTKLSQISKTINTDRLNPQFIGIAGKLSEHKKNRMAIQRQAMSKTTNFQLIKKMDEIIDRDLGNQRKELQRVKGIRDRYIEDMKNRRDEERHRNENLESLQHRSLEYRRSHRMKLDQAMGSLKNDRKQNHERVKNQMGEMRANNRNRKHRQQLENQYKFHSIENAKQEGFEKMNVYYRMKNKDSLDGYLQKIREEDHKTKGHKFQLKKIERGLKKYTKKVERKKNELQEVNSEIELYVGDNFLRKSRYNDRFEVFSQHSRRSAHPKHLILADNKTVQEELYLMTK